MAENHIPTGQRTETPEQRNAIADAKETKNEMMKGMDFLIFFLHQVFLLVSDLLFIDEVFDFWRF